MNAAVFFLAAILTSPGLTVKADEAHIKTIGGMQQGAWNLWSVGDWGDYVTIPQQGPCTVTVRCFGSPADGQWPQMALTIDGDMREVVTVDGAEARDVTFTFDAQPAHYRIAVSFLNDVLTKTEDRNLYVVSMTVSATGDAPPALCARERWHAAWAPRRAAVEAAVLAEAEKAIDMHRKRDAIVRVIDGDGKPMAGAAVSVDLVRHAFLFGCNIFMFDRFATPRENDLYKQRFADLFNYATTGFYWRWYEPAPGEPRYAMTDSVVAWCEQHGIRLKGHPLLWDCEHGIPTWHTAQPSAAEQRRRVETIMSRYDGRIAAWEVVNEPAHLPGLNIDEPYRWAREADEDAYLIVNDYQVLGNGCPAFFELLEKAIADDVPFDGIGIQAHEPRDERFELDKVKRILDRYAALGKDLHITEFSPASGGQPITGSHLDGVWDEAAQADYAAKFYTVCFAHPAVVALTWWDFCDNGSWLPGGGMLRKDLSPKPVYEALHQLVRSKWSTHVSGRTDAAGEFTFRGFHGRYRIGVDGNEQTFDLEAGREAAVLVIRR